MPEIVHAVPQRPHPVILLREAVRWARDAGHHVRVGPIGVVCASTHGPRRWELDPLSADGGINPIGCLLLTHQPVAAEPLEAAARVLGVHAAWVAGLEDGLALAPEDSAWISSARRELYRHGRESGVTLRIHVQSYAVQA